MDMKEKMPITPVTPVPTPSAAIAAEAHERGLRPSKPIQPEPSTLRSGSDRARHRGLARRPAPAPRARHWARSENERRTMSTSSMARSRRSRTSRSDIHDDLVTAFIGPSGCGKSTFLRCLNRMNDTIPSARVSGRIELDGQDITTPGDGRGAAARAGRHGVPEAEPISQVDLRECRLRPAHPRPCQLTRRRSTRSSRSR